MNLFEEFDQLLSGDLLKKVSLNTVDQLGDFELASKGIFYTLVAGLIRRSNSDMSAGMLFNQIQEQYKNNALPGDYIDNLSKSDFIEKVKNNGLKIISHIFPAYKSPLLSMISTYAGTSKHSTVLFSGIVANVLINLLGQKMKNEKMSKDEVVYYLKQHHEPLFKGAPEGLMDKMVPALGLHELNSLKFVSTKKPESAVKSISEDIEPINTVEEESEPLFNKKILLIILSILLFSAIAYYLYANQENISFFNKEEAPIQTMEENEPIAADSISIKNESKIKDSTLIESNLSKSEIDLFIEYVNNPSMKEGKEFDFKSIQFEDGNIELIPSSLPIIKQIGALMLNNSNLQVKIIAFSEAGDLKINNKRAFAVKKALMKNGVETIRIDAGSGGVGGNWSRIKVVKK
jgi:outer membrane protein OmpA-like peptidoglycan-associated protein